MDEAEAEEAQEMTMNTPDYLLGQCHRCGGYLTLVGGTDRPLGVVCQFCGQTRELTDRERESIKTRTVAG